MQKGRAHVPSSALLCFLSDVGRLNAGMMVAHDNGHAPTAFYELGRSKRSVWIISFRPALLRGGH